MLGRLILIALAVVVALGVVEAAVTVTYESITVAASSVGIGATTLQPAGQPQIRQCSARLETAQVRFRWDGTAPTASEGTILDVGDVLAIATHEDAARIRFIRTGGTSGVLKVHCWQ